ncbi:phosphotransferase [Streptomyces sp. NPDC004111]|uniref:phosphotransferase n=1 Tax=Streptomyces sp. NPDC004111 TaxID=3364690 RepID=UPI0036D17ACC
MTADRRLARVLELLDAAHGPTVHAFPATPTPWASTYALAAGDTRLVARLIAPELAEEPVVRTEFEAARLLGENGIGPRVRLADVAAGVLVMDRVDGSPVRPAAPWQALSLAQVLRRLHSVEPPGGPRLHVRKRVEASAAVAELVAHVPRLAVYGEAADRFDALRGALRTLGTEDRLCHNDLNPGNILFDSSRAWLIDFDHLGTGDPLFDVATATLSLGMDEELGARFVAAYLGRPATAAESARLELLSCLVLLRYGLSALSLVPGGLRDRLGGWTAETVGEPFVFDHRADGELGWSVFRLSLAFVHAGLARADAAPATRAAAALGLLGASV